MNTRETEQEAARRRELISSACEALDYFTEDELEEAAEKLRQKSPIRNALSKDHP